MFFFIAYCNYHKYIFDFYFLDHDFGELKFRVSVLEIKIEIKNDKTIHLENII